MCDQRHLHTFNDTNGIWLVLHVLNFDKEMISYGLSNDINHI